MDETFERKKIAQRLDVIANICVVAGTIVFLLSIGWFFLRHSFVLRNSPSSIQMGTKLKLPDIHWSASPQTLVLILSTECKYCTASAPFYRRLASRAALSQNTRLIAVFPQPVNESRDYFARQEIKIDTLKQAGLTSLGVKGTPTLILVDTNGSIIQTWEGMVPPDVEKDVIATIR
jgi:thioredoxin-related protein